MGRQYLLSLSDCNRQTKSNDYGQSLLHHAAGLGELEIAKSLIDKQCDINITDGNQSTPLHTACYNGKLAIVELLTSNTQCLLEALDSAKAPLYNAVCHGHRDIVTHLSESSLPLPMHQVSRS